MTDSSHELDVDVSATAMLQENSVIKCDGKGNRLVIRAGSKLGTLGTPRLEFLGTNCTLIIGEKAVVKRGHYRLTGNGSVIDIGAKSTINGAYFLCDNATIRLGEDCMLSYEIEFRTTDAHSLLDTSTGALLNPPDDIVIGDHCWIGKQACILQGVTLTGGGALLHRRQLLRPLAEQPMLEVLELLRQQSDLLT